MDDRYPGFGSGDHSYFGPHDQEQLRSPRTGGDYPRYSSARDYAAAGEYDRERGRNHAGGYGGGSYGNRGGFTGGYRPGANYGPRSDYGADRYREDWGRQDQRGFGAYGQRPDPYARGNDYGRPEDRGFLARAGDEVRAWFGDEDAERRREMDMRYDDARIRSQQGQSDDHYRSWRNERVAELDRDYDEYRRENAQRFHNEFGAWRTERQGQRSSLGQVAEHMDVVGSDGEHVGTVDKVRGDRIILTKSDGDAGGHHHSIPSRWIQTVDDKVTIRKTGAEAKAHWKDEERGAMFGEDKSRTDWSTDHNLNRSFSGTY